MTELSPVGTYNAPKPAQAGLTGEAATRHMLKQGRVLSGIDMKIVDGDGNELPWDGRAFGDLKVRGPWVASAYFGDEPGSALDADGWFATGDVATIDPDGFMEITDRSKDVIKSGGEWISSIALENIAVSHPDVAEAAVIAARHAKWDERPLLLVVPRPGHTVDPDSVLQMLRGQGGKMVAAGRRHRGGRTAAHRHRQNPEIGASGNSIATITWSKGDPHGAPRTNNVLNRAAFWQQRRRRGQIIGWPASDRRGRRPASLRRKGRCRNF